MEGKSANVLFSIPVGPKKALKSPVNDELLKNKYTALYFLGQKKTDHSRGKSRFIAD
jgi:hypothetical protein